MKNLLRCIVTGAGAPGIRGTLYALRHNPDNRKVYTLGIDINEDVVGRYLTDDFMKIAPPESEDYLPDLLRIIRKQKIDLIIPQTTREIEVLSRNKKMIEDQHCKVMVSSAEAIFSANNKWHLLNICNRIEIPAPWFFLTHSLNELAEKAVELGYPDKPVVVKPPVSNGMRGLRILMEKPWNAQRFFSEKPGGIEITLEQLRQIFKGAEEPELLVTEYLPGDEYSIDVFRGQRGSFAVPRLRRKIRSGISFITEVVDDKELIGFSLKLADELDLKYAFGFQFKLDSKGVPRILESNPRIQGTMAAGILAGRNIIWMAVKDALGLPYELPVDSLKPTLFYRFWGGLGINNNEVHEI